MKILDRKIARYTEQAVKYLPVYLRFGAQKEMAELVRQMLEDYSGKKEPDILDLREVLAEIGRPSELAETYLEMRRRRREERAGWQFRLPKPGQIPQTLISVILAVSVLLVLLGVFAVGTHATASMLPVFIGALMALVVVSVHGWHSTRMWG